MRDFRTHVACGLVAVMVSCGAYAASPAAKPAAAVKAEALVKDNMTKVIATFNAHNPDHATSFDVPGFIDMWHGAPTVNGMAEDVAFNKQAFADPAARIGAQGEVIESSATGDLIMWRAKYSYTYTDPKTSKIATEYGNWMTGWRREADDVTRVVWGIVADTPTQEPPVWAK